MRNWNIVEDFEHQKTRTISKLRGQLVISKRFSFVDILTNIESHKGTSQSQHTKR